MPTPLKGLPMINDSGQLYYHGNANDVFQTNRTWHSHQLQAIQVRHAVIERGLTCQAGDLAITGQSRIHAFEPKPSSLLPLIRCAYVCTRAHSPRVAYLEGIFSAGASVPPREDPARREAATAGAEGSRRGASSGRRGQIQLIYRPNHVTAARSFFGAAFVARAALVRTAQIGGIAALALAAPRGGHPSRHTAARRRAPQQAPYKPACAAEPYLQAAGRVGSGTACVAAGAASPRRGLAATLLPTAHQRRGSAACVPAAGRCFEVCCGSAAVRAHACAPSQGQLRAGAAGSAAVGAQAASARAFGDHRS
jgi:hypothetical protein